MIRIESLRALAGMAGSELGTTGWREVTQAQVDMFADATGDHQWIHVDPERAKASPLGGTIAHGHLTLALIPSLLSELVEIAGAGMKVNYGLNRVRFPTPVPVGSRVRGRARIAEVEAIPGGAAAVFEVTVEVEGREKPACVAETLTRFYTSGIDGGGAR